MKLRIKRNYDNGPYMTDRTLDGYVIVDESWEEDGSFYVKVWSLKMAKAILPIVEKELKK